MKSIKLPGKEKEVRGEEEAERVEKEADRERTVPRVVRVALVTADMREFVSTAIPKATQLLPVSTRRRL